MPEESLTSPPQNAETLEAAEDAEEKSSTAEDSSGESEEEDDSDDDDEDDTQSPGTVDGQFHSPPQIQRSAVSLPSSGSARRFFLSPLTDAETIEVKFEDVAHGPALLESLTDVNFPLGDNQDMSDVGHWGEKLVYLYLMKQTQQDPAITVKWVNASEETGEPYDIIITHGNTDTYIEVKSTIQDKKQVIEISSKEVVFAQQQRQFFHLYRVYNVGNTTAVRVCRIRDLAHRMDKKEVKLFMYI